MRGILIDPFTKTVAEVETDASLPDIYKQVGCDTFDLVYLSDGKHNIFVDDNGLTYTEPLPVFVWQGYPQPLAGRGLILGYDDAGATIACTMPLGVVWAYVTFPALEVTDITTHSYTRDDGTFVIANRPHFKRTGKD